jgi:hypothetical protein
MINVDLKNAVVVKYTTHYRLQTADYRLQTADYVYLWNTRYNSITQV